MEELRGWWMFNRKMKRPLVYLLLIAVRYAAFCQAAESSKPTIETRELKDGLRLVSVYFPHSTNVSIYTFAPLSLATDGPRQAQWSHLIEHLVIRSTAPEYSREINAETLPDNMRLDFYGNTANWQQGLWHHRRWLEGVPFTETNLVMEKPKVNQECDYTARNFATHKFAIAAWNQGFRHGQTAVKIKGDVQRATLAEVQQLRDQRLPISGQVMLCVVGGVEPSTAFGEIEKQFSGILLHAAPDLRTKMKSGNLDLKWDMNVSHLLIFWRIPDFKDPDYAALLLGAQMLNQALAVDALLPKQAAMIFAGADLSIPEGNFFYISASVQPGANFDDIRKVLFDRVHKLTTDSATTIQVPFIAQFLSRQLTEVPSLDEIRSQVPRDTDMAMMEGNLGLRFAMNEYRFGAYRTTLSQQIANLKGAAIQHAARKYLATDKAMICTIRPE